MTDSKKKPAKKKEEEEVEAESFAEQMMYRAADGCLKDGEVQTEMCLASEHSSDVAVNCCSGSMKENNLECSRYKKCVTKSTFAAAEKHCEKQGMRLCSVAELESGACCGKGCGWDNEISWTSDSYETSRLSSSSKQPSSVPKTQPTTSPTPSPSNQPTPLPTSMPSARPSLRSLRPSFQLTVTPSSQPTSTASSTFITSPEAMTNGTSFGSWKIAPLALAGVLLFCFVALGYHFRKKRNSNSNSFPQDQEEVPNKDDLPQEDLSQSQKEGNGLFSLSRIPSFQLSGDAGDSPGVSLNEVSAPAEEEAKGKGVGWYSSFLEKHNLQ